MKEFNSDFFFKTLEIIVINSEYSGLNRFFRLVSGLKIQLTTNLFIMSNLDSSTLCNIIDSVLIDHIKPR